MSKDRNQIIGERVRYYRTARNLSQQAVVDQLQQKMTAQNFALYETGQSRWPADLLCEISEILRVGVHLLYTVDHMRFQRKRDPDWEAEKYKTVMLGMTPRIRKITYRIIDIIAELN
jgi:transcriptional regulator with XRE-family HTH domain